MSPIKRSYFFETDEVVISATYYYVVGMKRIVEVTKKFRVVNGEFPNRENPKAGSFFPVGPKTQVKKNQTQPNLTTNARSFPQN